MKKIVYTIPENELKSAKECLKLLKTMLRNGNLSLADYLRIPIHYLNFSDMSGPAFIKKVKRLLTKELDDSGIKIILDLKTNESDYKILESILKNYFNNIDAITISEVVPLITVKKIKENFPSLKTILFCIDSSMTEEESTSRFGYGKSGKIFFDLTQIISFEPKFPYYDFVIVPEFEDKTIYLDLIKKLERENMAGTEIKIISEKDNSWVIKNHLA